jgi:hypothetical protein
MAVTAHPSLSIGSFIHDFSHIIPTHALTTLLEYASIAILITSLLATAIIVTRLRRQP